MLHLLDIFPYSELGGVFGRAETHSWIGCPSDLLRILYAFIHLAHNTQYPPSENISQLLFRLKNFDCTPWTAKSPGVPSIHARRSLAEAWKGAIEIYGIRVLGPCYPHFYEVPGKLVETTLDHLVQIPHDNTYFKGSVWPAFVAGAEANNLQQRQAIRGLFQSLTAFLHTSTLRVASSQLERIWTRLSTCPLDRSWVKDIWERKEGLLLI